MNKTTVVLLRIPAFLIDFAAVTAVIIGINQIGIYLDVFTRGFAAELVMFIYIPLGFFCYWLARINLGKRLFRLKIIDATSGTEPTAWQYLKRSLLFSLVVSLNVLFLIAPFVSRRGQALHDMLANTLVIRQGNESRP